MARKRKPLKDDSIEWIWKGPKVDGVTQSLIREFLICRERCRIKLQLGLTVKEDFSAKIAYGKMFHASMEGMLDEEFVKLCREFPEHIETIRFWKVIVERQSKVYEEYWKKHEAKDFKVISKEVKFDGYYKEYRLRGKIDALVRADGKVWIMERKTTSNIDDQELISRVNFDIQTGIYLTMMLNTGIEVSGIYYDVIRRPISGGKFSYRQKSGESLEEYISRIASTFYEHPEHYFQRYLRVVSKEDLERFNECFMEPILKEMNAWYESNAKDRHWITPSGLFRRKWDSLDDYIHSGVNLGLVPYKLFSELEDCNDNQD